MMDEFWCNTLLNESEPEKSLDRPELKEFDIDTRQIKDFF